MGWATQAAGGWKGLGAGGGACAALFALVAATLWVCPALAGDGAPVADAWAGWAALAAGGVSMGSLVGVGVTWGRSQQRLGEHERRLVLVEGCAGSNPQRITSLEAAGKAQRKADDDRHRELMGRFDRLEGRLLDHQHGS